MSNDLPSGYKRVLGFACNNNVLWQITGFKLQGSDTVRISFSVNDACNVFGCYQSPSATDNYDLYASVTSGSKYLRYGSGTYLSYFSPTDLGQRFNVVFTPTGTSGMPQDSTWTTSSFTSANDLLIAATTLTGTSAKLIGNLYGNFVVDGRLNLIPCERVSDGVLGYYDTVSEVFYPPTGTPSSLGYATTIQLRRDTASNWTSVNPTLAQGEIGLELDTGKSKVGDGATAWNSLAYDKASTALQGITSSDVTTALGYTPYNATNPNGYISGITSTDVTTALGYTPVNKAGDTMTGILQIRRESGNDFLQIYPNVSLTTPPASNRNIAMLVTYDVNNNVMAKAQQVLYSDGGNTMKFSAFRPNNNGEVSVFEVGWDANGNKYCTFPNTTCCDGQWVAVEQQLGMPTNIGSYGYDISSYLPNDSYDYEVLINGEVYNANSTYGHVYIGSSVSTWQSVAWVGTNAREACFLSLIRIENALKYVQVKITNHDVTWNNSDNRQGLYLVGYRRIGTNS